MAHAFVAHAGPAPVNTLRALVTAVSCAGAIALLCAAAAVKGPSPSSTPAAGAGDIPRLAPSSAGHSAQLDNDTAVRPQVGGIGRRHALRKPRRTNRRLRVPGGRRAHSGSMRAGTAGIGATQLQLKRKRMSKRSLMRRLMTVRGGLQA